MTDHSTTTRRTLLAGTLGGTALGGLVLGSDDAIAAVSVPSDPTSDFFLTIDGIAGESLDRAFPKSIEVLDWSWGVSSAVSPAHPGGGTGKSRPSPFTFVARTSVASPKLFLSCAKGTHLKKAVLNARRTQGPQPYLTITLKDVLVTSYRVAPAPVDAFPLDVVDLEYAAVTITYTPQ